ncbi:Protein YIPF5 [Smittium mucronatum]|uniref:Protein YIPF5 n=1 Tax=Smittium mucronatum TaxID=133383 RepID=A0A1R0GQW9_9FUNG|nr:Protein YIPF5 [Smittium mucronatum]
MSEGHSVLFDQDSYNQSGRNSGVQGYSGDVVDGLDFYQSNYQDSFGTNPNGFNAPQGDYSLNAYNEAPRMVEISLLAAFGTGGFPNEPPLLEELGVNFDHIKIKTLSVLNPFRKINTQIYEDSDIAGPLMFIVLMGTFMLLSGKLQFGYIYGVALMGWLGIFCILNLMSLNGIGLTRTASILGYCILPIVLLSGFNMVFRTTGYIKILASMLPVIWSTYSASTMFVAVLSMTEQRLLIMYPISIFYTSFVLMTVF